MKRLFRQFSSPGGIPSHVSVTTPGSIHEGRSADARRGHGRGRAARRPPSGAACGWPGRTGRRPRPRTTAELRDPRRDVARLAAVRNEPVTAFRRTDAGAVVSFASGPNLEVGGLFVTTALSQAAPFAAQLGLAMPPSGCVEVDLAGRTSLPGVYAAGDVAHRPEQPMPLATVLLAAGAGLVATSAIDQDLLGADWGLPMRY